MEVRSLWAVLEVGEGSTQNWEEAETYYLGVCLYWFVHDVIEND